MITLYCMPRCGIWLAALKKQATNSHKYNRLTPHHFQSSRFADAAIVRMTTPIRIAYWIKIPGPYLSKKPKIGIMEITRKSICNPALIFKRFFTTFKNRNGAVSREKYFGFIIQPSLYNIFSKIAVALLEQKYYTQNMNRTNVRTKGARNMDDAAIERLVTLWKHLPPEEQLTYLNQLERAAAALSVPDTQSRVPENQEEALRQQL